MEMYSIHPLGLNPKRTNSWLYEVVATTVTDEHTTRKIGFSKWKLDKNHQFLYHSPACIPHKKISKFVAKSVVLARYNVLMKLHWKSNVAKHQL